MINVSGIFHSISMWFLSEHISNAPWFRTGVKIIFCVTRIWHTLDIHRQMIRSYAKSMVWRVLGTRMSSNLAWERSFSPVFLLLFFRGRHRSSASISNIYPSAPLLWHQSPSQWSWIFSSLLHFAWLLTCPDLLNSAFLTLSPNYSTPTTPLTYSFLILFPLVSPNKNLPQPSVF